MSKRGRLSSRAGGGLVVAIAGLLVSAGVAFAVAGLQNPSFEQGLDGWTVKTERTNRAVVYGPGGEKGEVVPCDHKPYGICVVGTDTFQYAQGGDYGDIRTATVSPLDGEKMLRLGGPFGSTGVAQKRHRFVVEQTFVVDGDNPILELNYNVFTFDYTGFDEFDLRVKLTDEDGETISNETQGAFGTGIELKTSGWQSARTDLSEYAGQQVKLQVVSGGTRDRAYGFWTYLDAGFVEDVESPGEGMTAVGAPQLPGGGEVNVNKYVDPSTGQGFITIPASQVAEFDEGCMPLTLRIPIEAGSGSVSNATLILDGESIPMSAAAGGLWQATIPCVRDGSLFLEYDLTEGDVTQTFLVPLGGIVLIDPQGVVYDKEAYEESIADGNGPDSARTAAALNGASVTLQRRVEGTFVDLLSGDPGISPNVNPQITEDDGFFQWDVSEGTYRVEVVRPGYVATTSDVVDIPPPVLDLHVGMVRFDTKIDAGASGLISDSTPTFHFSANDPGGSSFECKIDAGPFEPCSGAGAHTPLPLSDGDHEFSVRAIDSHGYTDPTPAVSSFVIDATPPAVTIVGGPEGSTSSDAASFTYQAPESDVAEFRCSLDGSSFTICPASGQQYNHLEDGEHVFRVSAADRAGNVSSAASRSWSVTAEACSEAKAAHENRQRGVAKTKKGLAKAKKALKKLKKSSAKKAKAKKTKPKKAKLKKAKQKVKKAKKKAKTAVSKKKESAAAVRSVCS